MRLCPTEGWLRSKQKRDCDYYHNLSAWSDTDRIQTCDLLIRSQMLYSVELASQSVNEFEYSSDS